MLRATEQLTWSAVLDRFKRGYEVTSSNAATGKNQNDVDWQFFSGKHLRCKVTFTKPIDTAWPMQQLPSQKSRLLSNNEDSLDRQLRIIVECGPIEADDEQKRVDAATKLKGIVARSRSSSQTIAPLVLLNADLVLINKTYFHTPQRLKAVIVYRQNKNVLIRMLDEYDSTKAHRLQLEFNREDDVEAFLSLIEPDSTFHDVGRTTSPKKEETKNNQSAIWKVSAKANAGEIEIEHATDTSSVVPDDASQSQSLVEKLLQLQESQLCQPVARQPVADVSRLAAEVQGLRAGTSTASCSHCAHPNRCESSATTTASDATATNWDNSASVSQRHVETPLTQTSDESVYEQDQADADDDQDIDDGLQGWPDASAIECIQDDVCRLCLMAPHLDQIIAFHVDQHLRDVGRQ